MDDQFIFEEPGDELNRWEKDNISQAYSWLERRRNKEEAVSEEFLFKLHQKMIGKCGDGLVMCA